MSVDGISAKKGKIYQDNLEIHDCLITKEDKTYFLVSYSHESNPFWATHKQLSLRQQEEFYLSLKENELNHLQPK